MPKHIRSSSFRRLQLITNQNFQIFFYNFLKRLYHVQEYCFVQINCNQQKPLNYSNYIMRRNLRLPKHFLPRFHHHPLHNKSYCLIFQSF